MFTVGAKLLDPDMFLNFQNPSPDTILIFDNIGRFAEKGGWGAYQPSRGGPRYTMETSVLPYTADTLGYSCLSGNPANIKNL